MTTPPELAEQLRVAVGTFVRRARQDDAVGSGTAAVMGHLARQGGLSIKDLAARMGVRHQSMARTVRNLERDGWVQVVPSVEDGRRVVVTLTPIGLEQLRGEQQRRSAWIARAMETLSAGEQAELPRLIALLERLGR